MCNFFITSGPENRVKGRERKTSDNSLLIKLFAFNSTLR